MNLVVQHILIMLALLIAAVSLVVIVIRLIAGKGITVTFSILIALIVVIDSELVYILGQIEFTPLNVIIIFSPGILATIGVIYVLFRIVVIPLRKLMAATQRLAVGDLQGEVDYSNQNEMGQLATSLTEVTLYQREMAAMAQQIARGDLSRQIKAKSNQDEFGRAFQDMTAYLNNAIGQVTDSAVQLITAMDSMAAASSLADQMTSQISSTISQIAGGSGQQFNSINQTAGAIDQMSEAINDVAEGAHQQADAVDKAARVTAKISSAAQQVADNARTAADEAAGAVQNTQNGSQTVNQTILGMQAVKAKVSLLAVKVQDMGQRSIQIGAIVETIEDIASQTNLLALNAAIEAARAGIHGKGFAVVADEVRKLAEKSAAATREIGALVTSIQGAASEAVQAMKEGEIEVQNGVERAGESSSALESIRSAVDKVSGQVNRISEAARQMRDSSEELVVAMESVSTVVESNQASVEKMESGSNTVSVAVENIASLSEENSAAIEEVSASAAEMHSQVQEVSAAAQILAEMAANLNKVSARFKL
jgi:methyl-accepting chemotaxis protein